MIMTFFMLSYIKNEEKYIFPIYLANEKLNVKNKSLLLTPGSIPYGKAVLSEEPEIKFRLE